MRMISAVATAVAASLFAVGAAEGPGPVDYAIAGEWHDCPEYAFSRPGRIAVAPGGGVFVIDDNVKLLTEWTGCGSYRRAWKYLDDMETFAPFWFLPHDVAGGGRARSTSYRAPR